MRRLCLLLACATGLIAAAGCDATSSTTASPSAGSGVPEAAAAWVRAHAESLAAPGATEAAGGLRALRDVVGDARVVGLGGASYGARESFQVKHRVVRYLVEEMGFDAVVFEATMPESFAVNAYVRRGAGTAERRLADLHFWTWNTDEVLALLQWMRHHNARDASPALLASASPGLAPASDAAGSDSTGGVGFYGVDVQYPQPAMDTVEAYVRRVDPQAAPEVAADYACFRAFAASRDELAAYADAPPDRRQACRDGIRAVLDRLDRHRAAYVSASSARTFSRVRRHAVLVRQAEAYYRGTPTVRHRAMADNLQWLLDWLGPDARVVFWSHNVHVSRTGVSFPSTGSHLTDALGTEYVPIGITFFEGRIHALSVDGDGSPASSRRLQAVDVPPPPFADAGRYVEHYLRSAGSSPVLLPLRGVDPTRPATRWLARPLEMRTIGAVYTPARPLDYFEPTALTTHFDALLHLDTVSPTHLRD